MLRWCYSIVARFLNLLKAQAKMAKNNHIHYHEKHKELDQSEINRVQSFGIGEYC